MRQGLWSASESRASWMSCGLLLGRHDPLHLIRIGSPRRLARADPCAPPPPLWAIAFPFFAISSTELVPPRLSFARLACCTPIPDSRQTVADAITIATPANELAADL